MSRRGRVYRSLGLGVLAAGIALLAPLTYADGPPTNPDCTQTPTPYGCVTAIKYVDPATFVVTKSPDGSIHYEWNPAAPATVEQLPAPEPLAQAAAEAQQHVPPVAAPSARAAKVRSARAKNSARAHAAQYSSYCIAGQYPVDIIGGGYWHTARARSSQTCYGVSSHYIITYIERDGEYRNGDSAGGYSGEGIATNAEIACHGAGDHRWTNYSNFYAYDDAFELIQGPAGPLDDTHRCY